MGFPLEMRLFSANEKVYTLRVVDECSVPLNSCNFSNVQIRPSMNLEESEYEWSKVAPISLSVDERELYKTKPIILHSELITKKLV